MFQAIFWRYRLLMVEAFDMMKDAREFLENGEDYGTLSNIGIIDPVGVFHMTNNLYGEDEIKAALRELNLDHAVCSFISDPL